MKDLSGMTVLLTGASGGLGVHIAEALAAEKVNLSMVAYPGTELEKLKSTLGQNGHRTAAFALDLRDPRQRLEAVEQTRKQFGPIDILVNNAGVEFTWPYHELTAENIMDVLRVNLECPMFMTHLVLPDMLKRKRGHIVNMSSLAGKSGPAFQEPYAATKAGLIAFTTSLRATYHGTGVSASVICPGFVEAGIYARLKERSGCAAPPLLGTCMPQPVARAVVRAIQKDLPEIIINGLPVRPLFALTALFPSFGEWVVAKTGAHAFFARVVQAQRQKNADSPPGPTT